MRRQFSLACARAAIADAGLRLLFALLYRGRDLLRTVDMDGVAGGYDVVEVGHVAGLVRKVIDADGG